MRLCQRDEEKKGPSGLEEGKTIGAPLTLEVVKMMVAKVWDCCKKRELPYLSRMCI